MTNVSVVSRLAPSPTGSLHVGHALSFLLTHWFTRSRGGKLVLRLEDVDVERAAPEHVDQAQRDLEWLGIEWDGAPRLQSERLPELVEAARTLERNGHAYACICTRGDLRALGAPQAGQTEVRYPGTCRGRFTSLEDARQRGHEPGLRFRVEPGNVEFFDENYGAQSLDVAADVGDFLVLRRSGMPAYQLAVVCDDAFDGVTHVVRGSDLLPSTARQRLLQAALGIAPPHTFHVPLVVDETGRRLAKREADLSLSELRERGVDPRALIGWVAAQTGQTTDPGAWLTASELVASFDASRVGRAPIVFEKSRIERWLAR